jgi:hypothetical protein
LKKVIEDRIEKCLRSPKGKMFEITRGVLKKIEYSFGKMTIIQSIH